MLTVSVWSLYIYTYLYDKKRQKILIAKNNHFLITKFYVTTLVQSMRISDTDITVVIYIRPYAMYYILAILYTYQIFKYN